MVCKCIDHRKQPSNFFFFFFFCKNMEKLRAELALISVEEARALHLTSFLLSVLL